MPPVYGDLASCGAVGLTTRLQITARLYLPAVADAPAQRAALGIRDEARAHHVVEHGIGRGERHRANTRETHVLSRGEAGEGARRLTWPELGLRDAECRGRGGNDDEAQAPEALLQKRVAHRRGVGRRS